MCIRDRGQLIDGHKADVVAVEGVGAAGIAQADDQGALFAAAGIGVH